MSYNKYKKAELVRQLHELGDSTAHMSLLKKDLVARRVAFDTQPSRPATSSPDTVRVRVRQQHDANVFQARHLSAAAGSVGRRVRAKSPSRRAPSSAARTSTQPRRVTSQSTVTREVQPLRQRSTATQKPFRLTSPPKDMFSLGSERLVKRESTSDAAPRGRSRVPSHAVRRSTGTARGKSPGRAVGAQTALDYASDEDEAPRIMMTSRGKSPARGFKRYDDEEAVEGDGLCGNLCQLCANLKIPFFVVLLAIACYFLYSLVDWSHFAVQGMVAPAARRLMELRGEFVCDPDVQYVLTAEELFPASDFTEDLRARAVTQLKATKGIQATERGFLALKSHARLPWACKFSTVFQENMGMFIAMIVGIILLVLWWCRSKTQRSREQRVLDLEKEIYTMLKAQKAGFESDMSNAPFFAIVHLRDALVKDDEKDLWELALLRVQRNSCVSQSGAYIAGAQCEVLEWVAPLVENHSHDAFRSPPRQNVTVKGGSPAATQLNLNEGPVTTSYPVL